MVKSRENLVGAWAFFVGVILAIVIGLFRPNQYTTANALLYWALVILGVIIGFLNTGDKDSNTFLFASVSLVIVSALGNDTLIFLTKISSVLAFLSNVLTALLVLFIPATIIVALKVVFSISKI